MIRSGHHSRYDLICYNKNKLHRFRKKFELRLSLHSIIGISLPSTFPVMSAGPGNLSEHHRDSSTRLVTVTCIGPILAFPFLNRVVF